MSQKTYHTPTKREQAYHRSASPEVARYSIGQKHMRKSIGQAREKLQEFVPATPSPLKKNKLKKASDVGTGETKRKRRHSHPYQQPSQYVSSSPSQSHDRASNADAHESRKGAEAYRLGVDDSAVGGTTGNGVSPIKLLRFHLASTKTDQPNRSHKEKHTRKDAEHGCDTSIHADSVHGDVSADTERDDSSSHIVRGDSQPRSDPALLAAVIDYLDGDCRTSFRNVCDHMNVR